jgi:hypothetical protein
MWWKMPEEDDICVQVDTTILIKEKVPERTKG